MRIALGASRRDVLRLTVGQTGRLTAIGVGLGIVLSLALGRLIEAGLLGVASSDFRMVAGLAAILVVAALVAGYTAPGHDPVAALRPDASDRWRPAQPSGMAMRHRCGPAPVPRSEELQADEQDVPAALASCLRDQPTLLVVVPSAQAPQNDDALIKKARAIHERVIALDTHNDISAGRLHRRAQLHAGS